MAAIRRLKVVGPSQRKTHSCFAGAQAQCGLSVPRVPDRARGREAGSGGRGQPLIGSIRRECLNHIVVSGEAHLRRVLRTYAGYYNKIRTHRSLDKDAPISRCVCRNPHPFYLADRIA